jgi:hypothetical protein
MFQIYQRYTLHCSSSLWLVLLCSLFCGISGQNKSADYLIIEDPSVYTFLNEFEQVVSASEQKALLPYLPLQIVSLGEQLGDQITNVSRFRHNDRTIYILTDEKHQRIRKKTSWEKIVRKCTVRNDTVKVKRTITLHIKESSGPRTFTVTKGSSLVRVFNTGSFWYCFPLAGSGQYGWYQGNADVFETTAKQKSLPVKEFEITEISDKIKARLDYANAQYDTLFTWFNMRTSQNRSHPFWTMTTEGNTIRCTLKGSSTLHKQLEKSTHYIVSDLEHILLGKPYQASYVNGEITILPRKQQ